MKSCTVAPLAAYEWSSSVFIFGCYEARARLGVPGAAVWRDDLLRGERGRQRKREREREGERGRKRRRERGRKRRGERGREREEEKG